MNRTRELDDGRGAFDLIEEAFHLLRSTSAATLAVYYVGTVPFVMGLLYFWSDMSQSAFAQQRLATASLGMVVLYFWAKVWQSIFAQRLLAQRGAGFEPAAVRPARQLSVRYLWQLTCLQALIHSTGLLLWPLALALLVPFGWVNAFYQSATVLGAAGDGTLKSTIKQSVSQAQLWAVNNHLFLLVWKGFCLFVLLSWMTAAMMLPFLAKTILGIESPFTKSPLAMFNSTFFAVVAALTYLSTDPLHKAVYVLRCFYGQSLRSGHDLQAELRELTASSPLARVAVITFIATIALFGQTAAARPRSAGFQPAVSQASSLQPWLRSNSSGFAPTAAPAAFRQFSILNSQFSIPNASRSPAVTTPDHAPSRSPSFPETASPAPSVPPAQLDKSIDDTLQQPEYSWRLPRAAREREVGFFEGFVASIGDAIAQWIKSFGRWIADVMEKLTSWIRPSVNVGTPGAGWVVAMRTIAFVLLVLLVFFLLMYVFRLWQRSRRGPDDSIAGVSVQQVPDLTDHNVGADQLPEDEWIKLGRGLLARGELRLAMRAYYLASLAHLAQRNLITLAKYKSNYDYGRELRRRAHALPDVTQSFDENVAVFDRSWYGVHDIDETLLSRFESNVQRIKST